MTTLREAAQLALEAFQVASTPRSEDRQTVLKAQAALRTALANHSERDLEMGKPVAWIFTWYEIAKDRHVRRIIDCEEKPNIPGYDLIPLYTHPPQRKPLTEEEILSLLQKLDPQTRRLSEGVRAFARAIERAHGIGEEE